MRSSTLPLVDNKKGQHYKTKKDFYHISFASECQRCFETCVKPRRLPCEHEFCKSCLKEYFNKEIDDSSSVNTFPCPACDKPIEKPLVSKSKWTKSFKIDKSARFYADSGRASFNLSTERSSRALDRFSCKLISEQFPCAFWGGDVGPSGEIFLPDWYNQVVKVFTGDGKILSTTRLSDPPLDVTVLPGNTCVVSYGRVKKFVTLLDYENGKLFNSRNLAIDGYLYNITRLGQRCVGIMEIKDGRVTLATISIHQTVRLLDIGDLSRSLATESGICYDRSTKRIYLTEKHNFMCIDSGGSLIYERSFSRGDMEHYTLGAVACDRQGSVFIATDHCLLHIDTEGQLQGFVPTTARTEVCIMEIKDGRVTLATISIHQTVRLLDIGDLSRSLATESGICYDRSTKRIYLTEKHNFMCIDSGGSLIYERSFSRGDMEHYTLGAVACDRQGSVFIATDHCLLHIDTEGQLQGFVPTTVDPFYIMVSKNCEQLFIVGRHDSVEICSTQLKASATSPVNTTDRRITCT